MIKSELIDAYETGQHIRHKKGGEYEVIHLCLIRDGGAWLQGAVYASTLGSGTYCRQVTDFGAFALLREPI